MIPERVRVRIPREDLEEMRGGLTALFAPGARKGRESIISRDVVRPADEMLVGAKIMFVWGRHEATAYIYERKKPGVKATSCCCVGPIDGIAPSSDGELQLIISNTDWDTGRRVQSLMVLEAMDPDAEASA
ncbi:MAG: hypothetical protein LKJ94_07235 [Candidatus Methanomethylophilus sp.]|jgi:hypothetical protein|nr:hypothetical protein [Methanomethylophilus sp.]MCI2075464.1 hypothetical protein [Methanomethylophilus sp.]MCI2093286.1 hypothetical protein [Methanomethylophilus sp.]